MIEKLVITGPSGSGKTSALLKLLPYVQGKTGGFVVQRVRSGERVLGYSMIPSREASEVWIEATEPPNTCFLTLEDQNLHFHTDRFSDSFMQLTLEGDLMILDEIGGIELQLPEVRARILSLLSSNKPLLVIWKSKENLLQMIQEGKAPSNLLILHEEMEALIREHPKAAFFTTIPSLDTLKLFLKDNGVLKDPRTFPSVRPSYILLGFAVVLLASIVVSFLLGRYPIPPVELFRIVVSRIQNLFSEIPIESMTPSETVVWNIRFPRVLAACLVGASLSAAGAAYQGVFQNPMASPDILGATAGAAFGAALAIVLDAGQTFIVFSAFFFSILAVLLVWLIGQRARGSRVLGLILSGIMIGSLFSAATSFIKLVADPQDQLPAITYWLIGSLAGVKWGELAFVWPFMTLGMVVLYLMRWRINLLTLGDEQARTMGVNAQRLRMMMILSATLITAAAISISGMIGWVGLVIPHLSRRIVGSNNRYVIPLSMLFGAVFLLIVDNLSRTLFAVEIPIGILTAFIGAPFFLFLMTRKEGSF